MNPHLGGFPIEVEAPPVNECRVDEVSGERQRFGFKILAPWCGESPQSVRGAAADGPARDETRAISCRSWASSSALTAVCPLR
jgi:hypothetical protein